MCLVEGNQFTGDMKEHNACFALIPRKTEKQDELKHALEIESFLAKFQALFL